MKDIISELKDSGDLKGIFYEEDNQMMFYTETGIIEKIKENSDMFFVDQLFPGKQLTDYDYQLIEAIIYRLIKDKVLLGTYNKSERLFSSAKSEFSTSYKKSVDQYISLIKNYCSIFEKKFHFIRQILIRLDIMPL